MRVLKTKPPLEKAVEAKFMKLVKARGLPVKIRKMNGMGFRAWPDRLIIGPKKFVMWIEFKRPEIGKVSEGQEIQFSEMTDMGHKVYVFDDAEKAYLALELGLKAHTLLTSVGPL